MSLNLSSLESKLDSVVGEADSFAELVDKYADIAGEFAGEIPGGTEAEDVVKLVDDVTKALNALNGALKAE